METIEFIRVANLLLSVGLFATCMMRIFRDWNFWTRRERLVRAHLTAYLFVIAYGTVEALAKSVAPGSRVFLLLAVHTSFALGLWFTRRDPVR